MPGIGPLVGHLKGPVLALSAPFGGPRGPQRTPGDQIWSQLPPIGLTGLESWLQHTLASYRASSGPPGTPKGHFWPLKGPQNDVFWTVSPSGWFKMSCSCLKSSENSVATIWTPHMPIFKYQMNFGPTLGPFGAKRGTKGQNGPIWGPRRGPILGQSVL